MVHSSIVYLLFSTIKADPRAGYYIGFNCNIEAINSNDHSYSVESQWEDSKTTQTYALLAPSLLQGGNMTLHVYIKGRTLCTEEVVFTVY